MEDVSFLATEIREVGESVISNSQDLFLLINFKASDDEERMQKIEHGMDLVENILSIVTYLSTLDLEMLNFHEDLMNEVNKIKFSCYGLKTVLSKTLEGGKQSLFLNRKSIGKLLTSIKNAGNKIITISYIKGNSYDVCREDESCVEESGDICYEDRQTCEQYCSNGFCFEDKEVTSKKLDSSCPEYSETFTPSPLTHVENGYEGNEEMPWHVNSQVSHPVSVKKKEVYSIWDMLRTKITSSSILRRTSKSENVYESAGEGNKITERMTTSNEVREVNDQIPDYLIPPELATANGSVEHNNDNYTNTLEQNVINCTTVDENGNEETSEQYESGQISTLNEEVENDHSIKREESVQSTTVASRSEITTTDSYETTHSNYESHTTDHPTTPTYGTVDSTESATSASHSESATTDSYETTTHSYYESYTTEPPTTSSYETTTQDMYKLSQDISQVAQDLSSKSSEISSMSSEISSKSSDISSVVSELNNYEDDALSKKIQSVTKLTQEINSKTSEISSLTSTMSSLASDISSASSDMPSADRHHAFRTTPWQKMSSKSDDLISSAQGVVTASQDILVKVTEVVSASADLKVASTVATMAGHITVKTQRLISEALNILSGAIELMNVIDS